MKAIRWQKIGFHNYKTEDGIYEIKDFSYGKVGCYCNGDKFAWSTDVNGAKALVKSHIEQFGYGK